MTTKHNIEKTLSMLGQYSEALEIFETVDDTEVKELGEQHPTTLTIKNIIAGTLGKLDQYSETLEMFNYLVDNISRYYGSLTTWQEPQ